jgi:hypothetical protein
MSLLNRMNDLDPDLADPGFCTGSL